MVWYVQSTYKLYGDICNVCIKYKIITSHKLYARLSNTKHICIRFSEYTQADRHTQYGHKKILILY